jgi:paxillin
VLSALGKKWHPHHLICSVCAKLLGDSTFFEEHSELYCEEHYYEKFTPKCAYCEKPVKDRCVNALGKAWHPEHFFCSQCGKPFGANGYLEHDNRAFCEDDYYALWGMKCHGCNRPLMSETTSALGKNWHPECFVCAKCKIPFPKGAFFPFEQMPYCELHYHEKKGTLCPQCNKPIVGRCITAMKKKWHPEHFNCSYCKNGLSQVQLSKFYLASQQGFQGQYFANSDRCRCLSGNMMRNHFVFRVIQGCLGRVANFASSFSIKAISPNKF